MTAIFLCFKDFSCSVWAATYGILALAQPKMDCYYSTKTVKKAEKQYNIGLFYDVSFELQQNCIML
jgi:hypothetical protein